MKTLREDVVIQADLGRAEARVRSARAFLYETLHEAWKSATEGDPLSVKQRAMMWLASTHAASSAKKATELMFSAGGSASAYSTCALEKCVRDIHAAGQPLRWRLPIMRWPLRRFWVQI